MPRYRYTADDLRRYETRLNHDLGWSGSTTRYLTQRRNGYVAIDIYDALSADDTDTTLGRTVWRMADCLRSGMTTRECALVLEGMLQATYVLSAVVEAQRTGTAIVG